MLGALKLTFTPSIASASCLAVSSQRSARAGDVTNAAKSASAAARRIGRRNCRRDVICRGPFIAIQANGRRECKGGLCATANDDVMIVANRPPRLSQRQIARHPGEHLEYL